jgi:hypothetical protein
VSTQRIADSSHRRSFVGGSDVRIIMGAGEPAVLQLWRNKRSEAEPEGLPGRPPPSGASVSSVGAAHADFVAALTGHPPRTIPVDADAIDLEDRADHLGTVFSALSVYVAVIIDDTAQNASGRLDLPDTEAILADLASDVTGIIQHAAEGMGWRDA